MFASVEAVFKIQRTWKGAENESISVFTSSMSSACGYGFKKGITYLVYAYGNAGGRLSTSICSRTSRFEEWHDDFEELGPGTAITKSGSNRASQSFQPACHMTVEKLPFQSGNRF